jgi:phage tail sheath protein FI
MQGVLMPVTPTYPGVYVEEIPSGVRTIAEVATSITAFIGRTQSGPVNEPLTVNSFKEFEQTFGGLWNESMLSFCVRDFFVNGGTSATIVRLSRYSAAGVALTSDDFIGESKENTKTGLYSLEKTDLFNLLCIPPYLATKDVDASVVAAAAKYCEKRRAMFIVDAPTSWDSKDKAKQGLCSVGTKSKNAALFFPRLRQSNPLHNNQVEEFAPCGAVAGVFARTDATRGVWKAPAGIEGNLVGVSDLSIPLSDEEMGELNPLGINCLRALPTVGNVIWGARTLDGADQQASEWKYVPVRRLALFLEESLFRGTKWVVLEPDDERLWAQIRLNVGAFMQNLFRQGAFQGKTPIEAYFVKCDKETTTQNDIDQGIVNILVGFAPLKPAEFVIIKIQQIAGQIQA